MGLSVLATARKLKSTRNDALYDQFVHDFLPEGHGRGGEHVRNARLRFHLECESLGQKQHFEQLLSRVEQVRTQTLSSVRDIGCCDTKCCSVSFMAT